MIRAAMLCVAAVALLVAGCNRDGGNGQSGSTIRIAVIPKGTTHEFWKSVEAGAKKAGEELNVQIIWKGPLKEDEKNQQIGLVEQFVSDGVSGICLAPLDDTALLAPVRSAAAKKIPVVIYDSALKGEVGRDFVSFVATNNKLGGRMAGEELIRVLGDNKKVVLLRYKEGSASTMEREAGFLEAISRDPRIKIIEQNRYAGATMGEAQTAAMNMIDKLREAGGIFCPNESSTMGMLLALRQNGLAGKVTFIGFDASPPLLEAVRKGEIHGLIAQDPTGMGYKAVQTMVKHLKGEKVPDYIDTGCKPITKADLDRTL
ncbi:MAG TPA: substrate-binding domain-containing protein [Tepidisphaeraceae bacterium]|jgi:ribose transport system substrate-binding protein|nr:substrate-binding domain-containing protein [Tepidisphaeraceae bacterium]